MSAELADYRFASRAPDYWRSLCRRSQLISFPLLYMAGLLCWRRVERRRLALRRWFNTISPDLVGTRFDIDASGILCGGQAGFDYQTGSWVIGIEGSGGRRRPRIAAEGVPSSQAPTTTRRMSICRPPSPDASVTHETSGLLRKSRLGRRRISSSLCSTMGRRACQLARLGQWLDGWRRRRIWHLQELFARRRVRLGRAQ